VGRGNYNGTTVHETKSRYSSGLSYKDVAVVGLGNPPRTNPRSNHLHTATLLWYTIRSTQSKSTTKLRSSKRIMETLQEASRQLHIPVSSLTYYRLLGKITVYKSGSRNYLVDVQTLKRELDEAGYRPRKKKQDQQKGEDTHV